MSKLRSWTTRRTPRISATPAPRFAVTPELITALWERLTARDRWLLRMLAEHRVLTTPQIAALGFTSQRVALDRLAVLFYHRAVYRSRPSARAAGRDGSLPYHWVLDEAGAHVLAAEDGMSVKDWGWRRDHAVAPLGSATLTHLLGTNQVFVALVTHARRHPEARLVQWWGERRCAEQFGDIVHPDGYARWAEAGRQVEFYCEYDTGTEPLDVLVGKLDRYTELHAATSAAVPVLFVLPGQRREVAFRRLLHDATVPAATTARDHLHAAGGPAGACWLPTGHAGPRRRLAELSSPHVTAHAAGLRTSGSVTWAPDPMPPDPARAGAGGAA